MQLGIIGKPLVGKTTIFELLSEQRGSVNTSGQTNQAMAKVPDERIDYLSEIYQPKKTAYAQLELIDIPGLSPDSEKSSRVFLDQVRKADALLLVIKLFKDEFDSDLTPLADIENISYELLLSDLDLLERRIERINSNKKKNKMLSELHLLERLQTALEKEQPLSSVELNAEEQEIMKTYQFLTNKPLLVCLNLDESYLSDGDYPEKNEIKAYADDHDLAIVELSAGIELEIAELEQQEKNDFYRDLGIAEPGLIRIIQGIYRRLGLISFFTVGEDEVKAWTIPAGMVAKLAAGKIHSDIERGFIRAEVVAYDDLRQAGNMNTVKEQGKFRLEGKEYIVEDGDIVHFRFNV